MPTACGPIGTRGATIELLIGVNLPRCEALRRTGFPVPAPVRVVAQIDTGTTFTVIDGSVLGQLDVRPIDQRLVRRVGAEQEPVTLDQYVVHVQFNTVEGIVANFHDVEVLSAYLCPEEGIQALLGQDVLRDCVFEYNGPVGRFSLTF